MLRVLNEVRLAISFLTRIPIGGKGNLKKIPAYFTLVGYLPGAFYALSKLAGTYTSLLISLTLGWYLFDLFHFDGFLDTIDGMLSGKPSQEKLKIMSAGNVGPSAVFYGAIYVIAYFCLFRATNPIGFLYMSVFGRLAMNFTMELSKPAKNTGLGKTMHPYSHKNTCIALAITFPLFFEPALYVFSLLMAFLSALFMSVLTKKEIGGYTGDVLGFVNITTQILVLMIAFLMKGG